ncbi:sensor histidine kinase [Nonomuraea guangzhouensis]|uniref:histidine kinase n=1 Tax=Nonomuraea guangzhouensis TaxID=1291555 RepID=A0ABW4GE50_9ACTN|nr:HAMP domain-containing sensor histidine kinase [Nonomuraea guangzhouensis]
MNLIPRTLRGRLLTGITLLVSLGLAGSALAAYAMLSSFFESRAARQLTAIAARVDQSLSRQRDLRGVERALHLLDGDRVEAEFLDTGGKVAVRQSSDAFVRVLDAATIARLRGSPEKIMRLEAAGNPYRARYHRLDTTDGLPVEGVVIALSLRNDEDTLDRLARYEVVVTSVALLALVGLAVAVLRVGLRPLESMAVTATAIAQGDRTRRIPAGVPRTETGRLATALNHAFDEQHQAEERLRRFVADVSHELRTPLTTIGGWAELYFHNDLPAQTVTTAMSRIAEEAASMRNLVEELLLLARLDQQRPLETAPLSLVDLVEAIVSDARLIDPDRPITLSAPADDPLVIIGDVERLRRLVRNLLGNALQHTPSGTAIRVGLFAPSDDDAVPRVRLVVADEGPGIAPSLRPHLFERFSQGDPVRRQGSGLGLSIARAIAEAHQGTIELRTGSEFVVTLPANAGSA